MTVGPDEAIDPVAEEAQGFDVAAIQEIVEEVVRLEGLEVFDIELPSGASGLLRVFIVAPSDRVRGGEAADTEEGDAVRVTRGGVSLDDCARVSKRLGHTPGFEEAIPERCTLEVSSPGINRKLSRPEHFRGAVGERVRVVAANYETLGPLPEQKEKRKGRPGKALPPQSDKPARIKSNKLGGVLRGVLSSCDDRCLEIEEEVVRQKIRVELGEVKDARVDFLFP